MAQCMYKQKKDVIFRKEEDEAILFDPDNSDIVVLNSTGCLVWSMCDGNTAKEAILNAMLDEFDVSTVKAQEDLDKFFNDLEKKKFIEKTN